MLSRGRLSFRASLSRGYATRRPERPPPKFSDPLKNNPHATVKEVAKGVSLNHRPPPTTPTPYSTTLAPASPLLRPRSEPDDGKGPSEITVSVPPRVRQPREFPEQGVLSEKDFEEMRRLRASNPAHYTRSRLAKMFNCAPFLVGQQVPLERKVRKEAKGTLAEEHQRNRENWGERKALVMAIRKKRREYW